MKTFNLKYGFWTTYEQTVFLKQEKNQQGKWVLKISNIIKSTTTSNLKHAATANLRESVSLRECMLYLMCETGGPLQKAKALNNDKDFISAATPKAETGPVAPSISKLSKALSQVDDDESSDEKLSPAELREQQARSRHDRAAKRAVSAPGTGAPLQSVHESSQDRSVRKPSLPSTTQVETGVQSEPSSRASSKSSHPPISSEAKGKQKATEISPERRVNPVVPRGISRTARVEESRARSSSSQRHGRSPHQQPQARQEGIESEDLYGVSDEENRPPSSLPIRLSRGRPPQPRQSSGPATAPAGSPPQQPSGQRATAPAAPLSQQSSGRAAAPAFPPPQQAEPSLRRSRRQRGPPGSPIDKLKGLFHHKDKR
jgi:hypothetical protein